MSFDYCIFIGRFQPFHFGHLKIVEEAFKRSNNLIVVIGSAYSAKSSKNPWTADERQKMIESSLTPAQLDKTVIIRCHDYMYNDNLWLSELQQKVSEVIGDSKDVALIGHDHDRSSYYLKMFPQWKLINLPNYDEFPHATDLRYMIGHGDPEYHEGYLPPKVDEFVTKQRDSGSLDFLTKELEYIHDYQASWENAPFPPIFVTTDCVVIKSGHLLVVKRRGFPGKGQLALPGGFLKQDEKIITGALRELKEETAISLSKEELGNAIVDQRVFDHPSRSVRGRTITHAFLIDLKHGTLPKVKGSDDAEKASWMPLSDFYTKEDQFFEDHWHIVHHFISKF